MVDFFDTEIESIKTWLIGSGQPVAALESASIYSVEEKVGPKESTMALAELVKPSTKLVVIEPKAVFDAALKFDQATKAAAKEASFDQPIESYYLPPAKLDFGPANRLSMMTLAGSKKPTAELKGRKPISFTRDEQFVISVKDFVKKGFEVYIALSAPRHQERIREQLVFANVALGDKVHIIDLELSAGFIVESMHLCVLTTNEIYPRLSKGKADRDASSLGGAARGSALQDPTKLSFPFEPGDYIVHSGHGIGLFSKVEQRSVDGVTRDYLFLKYAEGDMLYTPIDQIDKISKYVGADGSAPKVTRLGGKAWTKAREKAKNAAKQLAFDLTDLYARRSNIRGFAFSEDSLQQAEMEAGFRYEATPDQLAAIRDVKADMESRKPMDRLIIGDVGYGKTEVAIRAAFKAAQDSKQTMLLCPTTILAQQHFTQWLERLSPFGVKVEVLSRFRTPAQQRDALERFAEGEVHILIGTHRLLSADIVPKDLGLLIIDEEQRFGVEHKEQLKHIREQIDVLSLSATPIPRTLQMSLSGVRDLSLIDTPPAGRVPVKVHVGQYDEDIVSAAIRHEIQRNGQVYYISNRVKSIDDALERVHNAAPEARVGVAHGQMSENELEYVMEQFSAQEIEVLLATTIVESGIDNPHTNTLIIEDSQRLGLSQLYQLKGRVGRSHSSAFAYFFYPPEDALTQQAIERLSAIAEHDELGAGIKIAMRDLEIRGAGSIVGAAQSGQLSAVGFDLFASMLSNALAELRGNAEVVHPDIRIDISVPAYLAEEYISDIGQRVLWYRRIAAAKDEEDLDAFHQMMIKEYGVPPAEGQTIFTLARIRLLAGELEARWVELKGNLLKISVNIQDNERISDLMRMNMEYDRRRKELKMRLDHEENVAKQVEKRFRAIMFEEE
jgi:transcription-repair coupling factor (superfamily II helicase)